MSYNELSDDEKVKLAFETILRLAMVEDIQKVLMLLPLSDAVGFVQACNLLAHYGLQNILANLEG